MNALGVIMVGSPRSGTYWVVDLLQTRFGIHIPSETHFVPLFGRFLWLWGDLGRAKNRARLLTDIYQFLQIWTVRSSDSVQYIEQIRNLSLLICLDEGRSQAIVAASHDYASLVQAMYREFADIHGANSSGDKSAHFQVLDPQETFSFFPNALMLHVVRDGRDVAMSWVKQWFGPSSIADAAQKWRDHIEVNRAWGRQNPERYLEVRYEDLATNKEGEIAKLESFLQLAARSSDAEKEGTALARALAETGSHSGMLKMVAADNVTKWKTKMPKEDVDSFERIAAAALRDSGYEVSEGDAQIEGHESVRFSRHALRVFAKTALPIALGVCTRVGIPLVKLLNRSYPSAWRTVKVD